MTLRRKLRAVVHADAQTMFARREHAEIGHVRRHQAVVRWKFTVVHPDRAAPVGALEKQSEMLSATRGGNVDIALIPRDTQIMFWRLGEKRHFHAAWSREMLAQIWPLKFP